MSALQRLYQDFDIETVHAVTGASLSIETGHTPPRSIELPEGNYLIVKVVEPPTKQPGLFAVQAPKEKATAAE